MPFLSPKQQRQSTEGLTVLKALVNTAVMRSFLLADSSPILQFLVGISDVLQSHHELLYVIKALVQHLLKYTHVPQSDYSPI